MSHHPVAQALLLTTILGLVPPTPGTRDHAAPGGELQLSFTLEFAGPGPDGSGVWEGRVAGATGGTLRVRMRQVEEPAQAANPVWHVRAHWTVDAATPTRSVAADFDRSFAADLEGMVDWKSGSAHLAGTATSGWMRGAWVEVEGRFVNGDATGVLRILPSLATR